MRNYALKDDIRAYWSQRAATFDLSVGHRIEDSVEAPAWQDLFTDAFGPLAGKRALDLACGTGEMSRMLLALGAEVVGLDFSEEMMALARVKHAGRPWQGRLADVEHLVGEADDSYDAMVTRHLVWTLVDPHRAFAEWLRVLKPGGRLLVVDGDWVRSSLRSRVLKALADRLGGRGGARGHVGIDPTWQARLTAQVHYNAGLSASDLTRDVTAAGFARPRQLGVFRIYGAGMRKSPVADRLRLLAAERFAVVFEKPTETPLTR